MCIHCIQLLSSDSLLVLELSGYSVSVLDFLVDHDRVMCPVKNISFLNLNDNSNSNQY
jgi:hypothetical protein